MIVGIPGWDIKPNEAFGLTLPYIMWAEQFGEVRILTHKNFDPKIDLLILPGGADVDPKRYNDTFDWYTSKPNMFLEDFDKYQLPKYIENKTPIFGICRGMQTLAVHFGGQMIQHLYDHKTSKDAYEIDVHGLKSIFTGKAVDFKVGSWHHQAVLDPGEMCVELTSLPSKDCGETIEAIYHPNLPIYGVQWHPERCHDTFSRDKVYQMLNK
ncbi:hypothetical protein [Leptolyngbya phage Lbo-JY46]